MAKLEFSVPATTTDTATGDFSPLPDGWYDVRIASAEVRQTKAGNGQYIAVRYDVDGPTHAGRVVFGNLNVRNANPKAEEIGRQQLGDIARALGIPAVSDTDQIVGGVLSIKLATRKSEEYGDKNEVKGFRARNGSAPPSAAAKPAAAPARATPPWMKK